MTRAKKTVKTESVDLTMPNETEPTAAATVPPAAVKVSKVGNLHCLLCFRSDMVEDDIGQFMEEEADEADDADLGDDAD